MGTRRRTQGFVLGCAATTLMLVACAGGTGVIEPFDLDPDAGDDEPPRPDGSVRPDAGGPDGARDTGAVDARNDRNVGDATPDRNAPDTSTPDVNAPDVAPVPVSVTLSASPSTVTSDTTTVTLVATGTSSVTIGKIELYEGTTLLGTRNASPAQFTLGYVRGDNGTHSYTAKAYVPTNSATSAPATVEVAIPAGPCGPDQALCRGAGCAPTTCLAPSHVTSGFGAWSEASGLRASVLTTGATFDTATGNAGTLRDANLDPTIFEVRNGIGFVRVAQGGSEPPLAIWVFKSLAVSGGTVDFVGDASAVWASGGDVTVASSVLLDVSAAGRVPGPGGFLGGRYTTTGKGCAPGVGTENGGGGGAFGTNGGAGGSGAGGSATSCSAYSELVSLRGGSGGGGGDDSSSGLAIEFGGAGGGALQITALGNLRLDGVVNAGGGAGRTPEGNGRNGAGGGSGGAIFLESPSITLGTTAGLFANGGGGGSFSSGTGSACTGTIAAEDGKASLVPAAGSRCNGSGGDGAAGTVAATSGSGGGGGLGRVVLRTLPGATPSVAATALSPGPGSSAYVVAKTLGQ